MAVKGSVHSDICSKRQIDLPVSAKGVEPVFCQHIVHFCANAIHIAFVVKKHSKNLRISLIYYYFVKQHKFEVPCSSAQPYATLAAAQPRP